MYSVFLAHAGIEESPWDAREAERAAMRETRADEQMAQSEMDTYVSGRVISLIRVSGIISVRESDSIHDENKDGSVYECHVNDSTTFSTASSLGDIAVDDYVTVDYYVMDGRKIAEGIILDQKSDRNENSKEIHDAVEPALID